MAWFRFHESMHIGELVWLTLQYLRENPTSEFRNAFDHVLVDEYQDLNRAEQELLNVIVGDGDFTIVGDEDQSFYSFRYAHPQGIRDFSGDHPGTYDIPLRECRRCPRIIVSMEPISITSRAGAPRRKSARGGARCTMEHDAGGSTRAR
jgi:DNA helicase II / ATP-dependent DNA helicase PcrA